MVNLLITVDTEFWPVTANRAAAREAYDRCILGKHGKGEHGLRYQIERFNAAGLKAVFFVEALHAGVLGDAFLLETVELVQGSGHDVELHLHTEWLEAYDITPVGGRQGRNMKDFSETDQLALIEMGLENLRRCGADNVKAFRAGNYGANRDTLKALRRAGIAIDSSYNFAFLDSDCGLDLGGQLTANTEVEGVLEVPVTCFEDRPGHMRPMQICAVSLAEMKHVVAGADAAGHPDVVMVSHGFEFMNRARTKPDPVLVRRFERLCDWLVGQDNLQTVGYDRVAAHQGAALQLISSGHARTAARMAEQALSRVFQ